MVEELKALRALAKQLRLSSVLGQDPSLQDALQRADAVAYALDEQPDLYGEALRRYLFVGPGLGCYANFDLRPEFSALDKATPLGAQVLRILFAGQYPDCDAREVAQVSLYASATELVAWWWDGDGTLLVGELDEGKLTRAAVNDDCKKAYGWRWASIKKTCAS